MKKTLYSALAITSAITGVMASKASFSKHRAVYIYKYIGPCPTSATFVTNVSNWTLATTIPSNCNATAAACVFTSTIPPITVGGGRLPSSAISAVVGGTIAGINYYIPAKKTGSSYTYLHAYNQNPC